MAVDSLSYNISISVNLTLFSNVVITNTGTY